MTRGPSSPESLRPELDARGLEGVAPDGGAISLAPELSALSEMLLAPALPHLTAGAPVTIVTHMALQLMPFGAMPLADGKTALIDAHPLATAPSLTVLRQLLARAPSPNAECLVVGGSTPAATHNLHKLPGSLAEAAAVGAYLKAEPLGGAKASAEEVGLKLARKELRCVHIACHSAVRTLALSPVVSDEAKAQYKAVADAQRMAEEAAAKEGEDSEVAKAAAEKAEELYAAAESIIREVKRVEEQLPGAMGEGLLNTDMLAQLPLRGHPTVFLTGSHAGAGSVSIDALDSLPRSLLMCGARSVISSVWDVDDGAAAHLARAFYELLAEEPDISQAEALRGAITSTRVAEDGKWDHPAYWAGFSVIGAARGL